MSGAQKKYVPRALHVRVLYLPHSRVSAIHPRELHTYNNMRHAFFWPHIAKDAHTTVMDCCSCPEERPHMRQKRKLLLFLAARTLEYKAIDILQELSKDSSGYKHVIILTDHYSQLTWTISTAEIISTKLGTVCFDNWQFVSKYFKTLCLFFALKKVATTAYHLQTNCQLERYIHTIIARLHH